ncbi:hypothetical protein BDR07DRAFT_1483145 [Suillus spraguei]|nr:hypothetical protein BDR07DRAFT_1483145 [Suillus spraguei]
MEGKCDDVLTCKCATHEAKESSTGRTSTSKPAVATGKPGGLHYDTNGHAYLLDSEIHQAIYVASPDPVEPPASSTEFAGLASDTITPVLICELFMAEKDEYTTLIATVDPFTTSLDWCSHVQPLDIAGITYKAPNQCQLTIMNPSIIPLFLDSGASIYISNKETDFFSLCPIPPRVVNGVGRSSIQAIGVGTLCLVLA